MWRLISLAAAASIALAAPSHANTLVEAAARASDLLEAGKPIEALEQATKLRDTVWDDAPIGFTTAVFIDGDATGYGQYTPREGNVFAADEKITIYAEPIGYGYGRDGDFHKIDLDADIELQTPNGQILVRQESFTRLSASARRPLREFQITMSLTLSGLTPGDYVLVITLNDAHSDKTGSFSLPMAIPEPAPKPKPAEN